jgi:hypothetical protein
MNPAMTSGSANLTVKQRRAAKREEKLAKLRRQQQRSRRNRRIAAISIPVAVLAVVAAIVLPAILIPKPPSYEAGGSGAVVEGVSTFENVSTHVETPVSYPETPPAGGDHSPTWLNCGVYTEPVPDENAVHSLEHGAIWVTYDPSLGADQLGVLRSQLPATHVILSPYDELAAPIVLSGWNVQLEIESADDPRIEEFIEEYWQAENAPEPGASCTGGVDG